LEKILIIQTAFIGDVILSTAVAHKIAQKNPNAQIDYLVRKGNESLVANLDFINSVWVWDKKNGKHRNLWHLIKQIRQERYYRVINLQRFLSSGILTSLSRGKYTYGFDKNPLSFLFTYKAKHEIGNGLHETDRNQNLISSFTDTRVLKPILQPGVDNYKQISKFQEKPYICIAPASVWYTKQFPAEKWVEFLDQLPPELPVYMLGAPSDSQLVENIKRGTKKTVIHDLCGQLSLLESAALMEHAVMNYVNDSAPLHLASAVNAPVRAIFCSTVPEFGFGPLSDNGKVVQIEYPLSCRPCGLHGKKACPVGTFECALGIDTKKMAEELKTILKSR